MPQVEIKYSDDLKLDTNFLFDLIEKTINTKDPTSGQCKSRAYPAPSYKYTHVFISVSMMKKPHRDQIFTESLVKNLEMGMKKFIPKQAHFSLTLNYNLENYVTS